MSLQAYFVLYSIVIFYLLQRNITRLAVGGHNVESSYAGLSNPNDGSLTVCFPFRSNTQTFTGYGSAPGLCLNSL